MLFRWLLAALHLLALGIGLAAVWARARSLRGPLDDEGLRRVVYADSFWGIAAVLWIATGAVRAFTGLEKGPSYYLNSNAFLIKMALLALVLLLEVWPMVTLIRWRIARGRGAQPDTTPARTFGLVSYVQALIVVAMVFAATAMARGLGYGG
ncbi:MAG TPA: DUF2214 family protein [Ardenticatenaceae bacterium]|nr:DUF2214 family protein [Ardenticatenaceae bacterium]